MARTVSLIQVFIGTILFLLLLLVLTSKDLKHDMKTFLYFIIIVFIAIAVQVALSYDEYTDLQVNMKIGELMTEENI